MRPTATAGCFALEIALSQVTFEGAALQSPLSMLPKKTVLPSTSTAIATLVSEAAIDRPVMRLLLLQNAHPQGRIASGVLVSDFQLAGDLGVEEQAIAR